MNKYSNLLYKRGFLFTNLKNPSFNDIDSEKVFKTWHSADIGQYKLYYDPSLLIGTFSESDGKNALTILGMVLNPFDGVNDSDIIAEKLLTYKDISEIKFLEYLNQLSGRFVIISKQDNNIEIFNDACGTRTVFYDKFSSRVLVSSHSTLIASLMDYELSPEAIYFFYDKRYIKAPMKKLPGLISPYDGVYILTPNTKLKLPSRKVERIFPYKDNPLCEDYENLEEEIAGLMVSQLKLLNDKTKISASLTSGIDSRLTLAASKDISDQAEYFTYITKNSTHIEDAKVAQEICSRFNLNHKIYKWEKKYSKGFGDFKIVWEKNLGIKRGIAWLNKVYADSFPKNRIHVRSNIAEVAKSDTDLYKEHNLCPNELAYQYTTTSMKNDEKVIKKFEEFIDITDFKESRIFNYDYRDLFMWEYKMCQWHSWLLLESDMAHDTFIIYNNREILSKMLSLPYLDRINRKIFIGIIKRLWPELLEFPVNSIYIK